VKRYAVLILVVVGLVAAAGGVYGYVSQQQPDVIRLQVGQVWEVTLESNPSTGYSWIAEVDGALVEFVGSEFQDGASGMFGAPGKEKLTFLALSSGTARLILKYQRPWEGTPEKTVSYTLKIAR
jgi:predicted secreted protein